MPATNNFLVTPSTWQGHIDYVIHLTLGCDDANGSVGNDLIIVTPSTWQWNDHIDGGTGHNTISGTFNDPLFVPEFTTFRTQS